MSYSSSNVHDADPYILLRTLRRWWKFLEQHIWTRSIVRACTTTLEVLIAKWYENTNNEKVSETKYDFKDLKINEKWLKSHCQFSDDITVIDNSLWKCFSTQIPRNPEVPSIIYWVPWKLLLVGSVIWSSMFWMFCDFKKGWKPLLYLCYTISITKVNETSRRFQFTKTTKLHTERRFSVDAWTTLKGLLSFQRFKQKSKHF